MYANTMHKLIYKTSSFVLFQTRVQEIDALCESIFITQKYDKSIRKMRVTLNDIEESRDTQMIAKAKENDSLQNSINEIRQKSRQVS